MTTVVIANTSVPVKLKHVTTGDIILIENAPYKVDSIENIMLPVTTAFRDRTFYERTRVRATALTREETKIDQVFYRNEVVRYPILLQPQN